MLTEQQPIEASDFSKLVYELALDMVPNVHIADILGATVRKVEAALSDVRKRGYKVERVSLNVDHMHELFGIAAVISANLRKMTAFYESIDHPKPAMVAARRIGKEIGRSGEWVNAMALWHRKAVDIARVRLGGNSIDATIAELQRQMAA